MMGDLTNRDGFDPVCRCAAVTVSIMIVPQIRAIVDQRARNVRPLLQDKGHDLTIVAKPKTATDPLVPSYPRSKFRNAVKLLGIDSRTTRRSGIGGGSYRMIGKGVNGIVAESSCSKFVAGQGLNPQFDPKFSQNVTNQRDLTDLEEMQPSAEAHSTACRETS